MAKARGACVTRTKASRARCEPIVSKIPKPRLPFCSRHEIREKRFEINFGQTFLSRQIGFVDALD